MQNINSMSMTGVSMAILKEANTNFQLFIFELYLFLCFIDKLNYLDV